MLYLTFGLVIIEDNYFVHVCEKFKENLYVKAVMLNLISWTENCLMFKGSVFLLN